MAYVKKQIFKPNKINRADFGNEHKGKTIEDYWHIYFFMDKAYVDPSFIKTRYIFREHRKRLDPDNIQEKPKK